MVFSGFHEIFSAIFKVNAFRAVGRAENIGDFRFGGEAHGLRCHIVQYLRGFFCLLGGEVNVCLVAGLEAVYSGFRPLAIEDICRQQMVYPHGDVAFKLFLRHRQTAAFVVDEPQRFGPDFVDSVEAGSALRELEEKRKAEQ